jgi:DNA-binding HxlR family transcriptional regulator
MEKKFQVFVSSTFQDLKEERQEVIQALLELDCIPVGMELFPAADDDQWTLIKRLIDDCDYYILIVGGRYGSVNSDGISYTQMEYEYAIGNEIPTISFLHKNPENIAVGKSEKNQELKKKLDEFKSLVQKKMCKYYESPVELGSIVSRSLVRLIKDKPQPGWVRSTNMASEEATKELLELRAKVDELNRELSSLDSSGPSGTEELAQGADKFEVEYSYKSRYATFTDMEIGSTDTIEISWNEIFGAISPLLIDESVENKIASPINYLVASKEKELAKKFQNDWMNDEYGITEQCFHTILIQLKALGLITKSDKKRSIKDTKKYWTLTNYGENLMTKLRAIKKQTKK